jgi:hypothetical protein
MEKLLVTRLKVFPDGSGVVGSERKKFFDLRPLEKVTRTNDFGTEQDRKVWSIIFCPLFMVLSGDEVEGFCVESALGSGFAKAGFAKKNRLASGGDCSADGGKFLESLNHERSTLGMRRG